MLRITIQLFEIKLMNNETAIWYSNEPEHALVARGLHDKMSIQDCAEFRQEQRDLHNTKFFRKERSEKYLDFMNRRFECWHKIEEVNDLSFE